jgi:hypothetical protein
MSILDLFKGMTSIEVEELFSSLDDELDEYFSEHRERRRFMQACRKLSNEDVAIIQRVMSSKDQYIDYVILAKKVESPLIAANAILMLEVELKKTKDLGFLNFLLALIKEDQVVAKLNSGSLFDWEEPLVMNKSISTEFLEFIWDANKESKYYKQGCHDTVRGITRHPQCSTRMLKELLIFEDPSLRGTIARHANIDDELTNIFLNSKRVAEREEIVYSKYISAEAILSLMRDKFYRVAEAAKMQFEKRFPEKEISEVAISTAIENRIETPYVKPNKPIRKFCKFEDGRMGIEHLKTLKPNQKAAVISCASADVVEFLAQDSSKIVRRAVAESRHCPLDTLKNYVNEPDIVLANNAFQTLTSLQPAISCEEIFSSEVIKESYELLNTFINKKNNVSALSTKSGAKVESELERIYLIAQFSNNPMIHLRIIADLTEVPRRPSRRNLLQHLSKNLFINNSVIKKVAIDLGFASEAVLKQCKSKEVIAEYLADPKVPNGERTRLLKHIDSLK